ncbi:DUF2798 domain-containing protein [Bacillus sp. 179-C3.3 HS]|uniref:DUF2798 domain-containing protein n=1 Tax=Bacillus sp. 179-C3.3 HS TaxID=3232162 RepID=UPI0039A0071B
MPVTKKEDIQFGVFMCFCMFSVMFFYNLGLNEMLGHMTWIDGVLLYVIGFAVALIIELCVVGPLAQKVAVKIAPKGKKIYFILTLSVCIVCGMVCLMSLCAFLIQGILQGFPSASILSDYFSILGMNAMMAFPLQLLIMGPFVRFVFFKWMKSKQAATV